MQSIAKALCMKCNEYKSVARVCWIVQVGEKGLSGWGRVEVYEILLQNGSEWFSI